MVDTTSGVRNEGVILILSVGFLPLIEFLVVCGRFPSIVLCGCHPVIISGGRCLPVGDRAIPR